MEKIRWGILGTGSIAKQFARGLSVIPDAELAAVGSRTAESAAKFATEFKVPRAHASYAALAADKQVDAIYVATPHPMHVDNAILCLQAGKAVLCEKPFTVNASEAARVIATARRERRFLLEAMWTRFLPITVKVRELLAQKVIGEVRMVQADFGFRAGLNPEGRLFNPALAGGSLLDVGIYVVAYAAMVFGRQPTRIAGLADIGTTGVDEQAAYVLGYDRGELAVLSSAVRTSTPHEVRIFGTDGNIKVHGPFWCGDTLTLAVNGKPAETITCPKTGNGYNYQAVAVQEALRAGQLESSVVTLDETLANMKTLDAIRAQWGLRYPGE